MSKQLEREQWKAHITELLEKCERHKRRLDDWLVEWRRLEDTHSGNSEATK